MAPWFQCGCVSGAIVSCVTKLATDAPVCHACTPHCTALRSRCTVAAGRRTPLAGSLWVPLSWMTTSFHPKVGYPVRESRPLLITWLSPLAVTTSPAEPCAAGKSSVLMPCGTVQEPIANYLPMLIGGCKQCSKRLDPCP